MKVVLDFRPLRSNDQMSSTGLSMGGDQRVAAIGAGEALASVALAAVAARRGDRSGPFTALVAGQGGDRDVAAGVAADPDRGQLNLKPACGAARDRFPA